MKESDHNRQWKNRLDTAMAENTAWMERMEIRDACHSGYFDLRADFVTQPCTEVAFTITSLYSLALVPKPGMENDPEVTKYSPNVQSPILTGSIELSDEESAVMQRILKVSGNIRIHLFDYERQMRDRVVSRIKAARIINDIHQRYASITDIEKETQIRTYGAVLHFTPSPSESLLITKLNDLSCGLLHQ